MKYKVDFLKEAVLLIIAMFLMCITNSYGYKIPIIDSIKGIGLLCVIAWLGVCLGKFMNNFVKLPIFLYLSVIAMFLASPVSPIAEDVYSIASKVEFLTPTTALGAFAGISLGKDIKTFSKTGWKLIIVGLIVIVGTYLGSALIAQVVMSLTGNI